MDLQTADDADAAMSEADEVLGGRVPARPVGGAHRRDAGRRFGTWIQEDNSDPGVPQPLDLRWGGGDQRQHRAPTAPGDESIHPAGRTRSAVGDGDDDILAGRGHDFLDAGEHRRRP